MTPGESERLKVLEMIGEGKISAEEGARLLGTLTDKPTRSATASQTQPLTGKGRWFRVRVTNSQTGATKASVNIPVSLMSWGMNIGAQFAPEVANFKIDELLDMLDAGYQGKLVDVLDEEDGEHVEIFVE